MMNSIFFKTDRSRSQSEVAAEAVENYPVLSSSKSWCGDLSESFGSNEIMTSGSLLASSTVADGDNEDVPVPPAHTKLVRFNELEMRDLHPLSIIIEKSTPRRLRPPDRKRSDPVLCLQDRPRKPSLKIRSLDHPPPPGNSVSPVNFTITSNPLDDDSSDDEASSESSDIARPRFDSRRRNLQKVLPCLPNPTFEDFDEIEASDDSRLDLIDDSLDDVHRSVMARTSQKYLVVDRTSFPDRVFTGTLIVLTMIAILVLFWYQNFGPGFHFKHIKH